MILWFGNYTSLFDTEVREREREREKEREIHIEFLPCFIQPLKLTRVSDATTEHIS